MFDFFKALGLWSRGYRPLPAVLIAIGLAAASYWLLLVFATGSFIGRNEDIAFDNVMAAQAPEVASLGHTPKIAFINIDDEAHERLVRGASVFPRKLLADIMRQVNAQRPKAIVVDIDVGAEAAAADDQELLAALKEISSAQGTWVFLVRAPQPSAGLYASLPPAPAFDEFVLNATGRTRYVSADLFVDGDGIVRRALPDASVCSGGTVRQLLAGWLSAYAAWRGEMDKVDSILRHAVPDCARSAKTASAVAVGGHKVALGDAGQRTRVAFHIPWLRKQTGIVRNSTPRQGDFGPVTFIAAGDIFINPAALSRERIEGRVVIIGATHNFTKDIYQTPLGAMPGAVIIANAVHGFAALGPIEALTPSLQTGAVAALAALCVLVFAFLDWLLGAPVIAGLLTAGVAWTLSLFVIPSLLYASGIWFAGWMTGNALSVAIGFLTHNRTYSS
jgi:CHASE2 domain-containing sensor protein